MCTNIPSWTTVFGFAPGGSTDGTYFDIEVDDSGNYAVNIQGWQATLCPVDTQWHHFAATYNGSGGSWYLDGKLLDSLDGEVGTIDEVMTGAGLGSSNYFSGVVDDVRIYDRSLTPNEIKKLTAGPTAYDSGRLAWNAAYYWRVDEAYSTETIKGLVWSFTKADFILVDDFESYNDIDPPDPASNRIFDRWIDGFGTATNGALVGNDMPPYAEQTVVHGGAQSMPHLYDNSNKTSEATLTLAYPRDWTEEGAAKLSLWFRCASGSAADRIYIAPGDVAVYHDDAAATQIAAWTEWIIDLTEFAGLDLTNVNTVTIGFGGKGSPAAGGSGQMYFDDIRLYR